MNPKEMVLRALGLTIGGALLLGWFFQPLGPVTGNLFDLLLAVAVILLSIWPNSTSPGRR